MKKKEESPIVKKATDSERKKRLSEPFKGSSEIHENAHGFPSGVRLGWYSQPRLHFTALSRLCDKCVFKGGRKQMFKLNIPIQITLAKGLTPACPSDIQTGTAEVLMSLIQLNEGSAWMTRKNITGKTRGRHRGICSVE